MNLEGNERTEEWFLIIGDWFRGTNRMWFYALVAVIIAAIPLQIFLKFAIEGVLINSITPINLNYQEVPKAPLQVIEKKIFELGNNTYSGYAKVKNSNTDWGVPEQAYQFEFKSMSGAVVAGANSSTFVLPGTDKIIVFPRFSSDTRPINLDVVLSNSTFIRPPRLPVLDIEIQRRSLDLQVEQSTVTAVIVNHSPFKISRIDLPILLFDNNNEIIGANYTNINDLSSNESRSFQYVWYSRINNVARTEIIPEINSYNRDVFGAVPGQNPFDDRE